jgi:hypothetical protein
MREVSSVIRFMRTLEIDRPGDLIAYFNSVGLRLSTFPHGFRVGLAQLLKEDIPPNRVRISLPPRRVYVQSPEEAPPGVQLYTGPRGGLYYIPSSGAKGSAEPLEILGLRPEQQQLVAQLDGFLRKESVLDRNGMVHAFRAWMETLQTEAPMGLSLPESSRSLWYDANVRSPVKRKIVEEISFRSEGVLSEDKVTEYLAGWAQMSEDALATLRIAASQLWGTELFGTLKEQSKRIPQRELDLAKLFLEISYLWTQELLEKLGIEEVQVYRGVHHFLEESQQIPAPSKGGIFVVSPQHPRAVGYWGTLDVNSYPPLPLSSFSGDLRIADTFSSFGAPIPAHSRPVSLPDQVARDYLSFPRMDRNRLERTDTSSIITTMIIGTVNRRDIRSSCLTGLGCLPEAELLLSDYPKDHVAIWATDFSRENANQDDYGDMQPDHQYARAMHFLPGEQDLFLVKDVSFLKAVPKEEAEGTTRFFVRDWVKGTKAYVTPSHNNMYAPAASQVMGSTPPSDELPLDEWNDQFDWSGFQKDISRKFFSAMDQKVARLLKHAVQPFIDADRQSISSLSRGRFPETSALLSLINEISRIKYPVFWTEQDDASFRSALRMVLGLAWDDLLEFSEKAWERVPELVHKLNFEFGYHRPLLLEGTQPIAVSHNWRETITEEEPPLSPDGYQPFFLGISPSWDPSPYLQVPQIAFPYFFGPYDRKSLDRYNVLSIQVSGLHDLREIQRSYVSFRHLVRADVEKNYRKFLILPDTGEGFGLAFLPIEPLVDVETAVATVRCYGGNTRVTLSPVENAVLADLIGRS